MNKIAGGIGALLIIIGIIFMIIYGIDKQKLDKDPQAKLLIADNNVPLGLGITGLLVGIIACAAGAFIGKA